MGNSTQAKSFMKKELSLYFQFLSSFLLPLPLFRSLISTPDQNNPQQEYAI
jgi:hypothetical protein